VAAVLRGGGGAVREERKGGARDEEGVALPFYSPEGEGEEARLRRWAAGSVAPAPLMAARCGRRVGEEEGVEAVGESAAAH
jgi:hypothetical protein